MPTAKPRDGAPLVVEQAATNAGDDRGACTGAASQRLSCAPLVHAQANVSAIDDLHAMLKAHGDWMPLGAADEQKSAAEGTVEAWARSADNPVGGWYGLKKGLRGRFGNYVPPVLEELGLAEVEHNPRNNRMRAR